MQFAYETGMNIKCSGNNDMKQLFWATVLLGSVFMASAFATIIRLDCKIVSGAEKVGSGFEDQFCASLADALSRSGEIKLAKSAARNTLTVGLSVLRPNSADVLISWPNAQPLKLLINARDADLRPAAAQTLVLPILNLIKTN
jgi:hypothetical protein